MGEPVDGTPMSGVQVAIGVDVQQQGDGSWWVVMQWGLGPLAMALWLTPDNSEEYAASIPEVLRNAAQAARRKNSGLIVPGRD